MAATNIQSYVDDRLSKVEEYKFNKFDSVEDSKNVKEYEFGSFDKGLKAIPPDVKAKLIVEKNQAIAQNFIVSPIVKHHRGILAQEDEERQHKIQAEINRRVEKIKLEAFDQGYQMGIEQGKKKIYDELIGEVQTKIDGFEAIINETNNQHHEVLKQQKLQIYEMVRVLTKWVILRELKDDGQYLERLLERLINEVGTKSNLHIQVNKSHFSKMQEIIPKLEERLGKLQNVRVEVGIDISDLGINIESQNALIKGSLEDQFANLDKLFTSIGLGDSNDKTESGN
jgi:flagellar assembly protein FliH